MAKVTEGKVQSVTGHLTMKTTDHYTHFDTRQFNEIREVQATLLTNGKAEERRRYGGGRERRAGATSSGR
jgi:hypothetical protein